MKQLKWLILVIFVALALVSCKHSSNTQTYDWNNGYCSECGGELIYKATGSKEHYICENCGKEYTFDKVMSKK